METIFHPTETVCIIFSWFPEVFHLLHFCSPSNLKSFSACGSLGLWTTMIMKGLKRRSQQHREPLKKDGKMKYIEIESFSNLIVWACAALVVGGKPSPNPQKLSKTYCHISPIWTCHRSFFIMFILLSWQPSVSYIWPKFACSHSLDTEYWIYDKLWGKLYNLSCLLPSTKPAISRGWSKISIVPGPVEHMFQSIALTFGCPLWNFSNRTLPTCKEKTGANIVKQNSGIIWDNCNVIKQAIRRSDLNYPLGIRCGCHNESSWTIAGETKQTEQSGIKRNSS